MAVYCDECPHWDGSQRKYGFQSGRCDLLSIWTHASTGCLDRELELEREGRLRRKPLEMAPEDERPDLKLVR